MGCGGCDFDHEVYDFGFQLRPGHEAFAPELRCTTVLHPKLFHIVFETYGPQSSTLYKHELKSEVSGLRNAQASNQLDPKEVSVCFSHYFGTVVGVVLLANKTYQAEESPDSS